MKINNRVSITVLIAVLLPVVARIIPSVLTNAPFSNDTWPLIHATSILTRNPDKQVFDLEGPYSYHARWPAVIIFTTVISRVTGLPVIDVYEIYSSFIIGLSIGLLSYCIGYRHYRDKSMAFTFSAGLTLFISFTIYTSTLLKETYANLIALTMLLYITLTDKSLAHHTAWIFLTISLVLAHPLPALMIFTSLLISQLDNRINWLFKRVEHKNTGFLTTYLIYSIVVVATVLLYNYINPPDTLSKITIGDIAVFAFYLTGLYVLYHVVTWTYARLLAYLIITTTIVVSFISQSTLPYDWMIAMLAIPMPLILALYGKHRSQITEDPLPLPSSFLLLVSSIAVFISTWFTFAMSIIHRILNYLVYPFACYLGSSRSKLRSYIAVAILSLLVLSVFILIVIDPGPVFYYWRYTQGDLESRMFIENYASPELVIYGDPKYSYMLVDKVKEAPVDVLKEPCTRVGYDYLIIVSKENFKYGFPITPIDYVKIDNNVISCLSLFYNKENLIILGRGS